MRAACFRRLERASSARTWIVLPSPMSSARQAPSPSSDMNRSQRKPVSDTAAAGQGPLPASAASRLSGFRTLARISPSHLAGMDERPLALGIGVSPSAAGSRLAARQQPHALDERDPVAAACSSFFQCWSLKPVVAIDLDPLPAERTSPSSAAHQLPPLLFGQTLVSQGEPDFEIKHARARTSSAGCRRSRRPRATAGALPPVRQADEDSALVEDGHR